MRIECASIQSTSRGGLEPNWNRIQLIIHRNSGSHVIQFSTCTRSRPRARLELLLGSSQQIQQTHRRMAGWTYDETKALISAWGEENVQEQLDNVKRNKDIYMRISASLAEHGYVKSWKQCRVKVKNLTQRYRKVGEILVIQW